jgi:sugar/nucleoside kinase (ribokinase family)
MTSIPKDLKIKASSAPGAAGYTQMLVTDEGPQIPDGIVAIQDDGGYVSIFTSSESLAIDLTDEEEEDWNLIKDKGVTHVILTGWDDCEEASDVAGVIDINKVNGNPRCLVPVDWCIY